MNKSFPKAGRGGFSLVEVTFALAIVVFCLTALTGLLWVGLTANKAASSQSAANNILSAVISDLRATPATSSKSLLYGINIPSNPVTTAPTATTLYIDSDGAAVTSPQNNSTYLLTVSFLPPTPAPSSGTRSRTATFVDLKVSWPAAASTTTAMGTAETFIAMDRN